MDKKIIVSGVVLTGAAFLLGLSINGSLFESAQKESEVQEDEQTESDKQDESDNQLTSSSEKSTENEQPADSDKAELTDTTSEDNKTGEKDTADDTKAYDNGKAKLSFRYPGNFKISEKVSDPFVPGGPIPTRITLEAENSRMIIEANYEGYGPIFGDKYYQLTENADGTIRIASRETEEQSDTNRDGWRIIVATMPQSRNGFAYNFRLENKDGDKDYEKAFDSVLESMKIKR